MEEGLWLTGGRGGGGALPSPDSRPDGQGDSGTVWTLVKSLNSEGRISFSTHVKLMRIFKG